MPEGRPIEITTPLGDDVLYLQRMTVTEELGRMFRGELELLADEEITFDDLLGQDVTIKLELPDDGERFLHGYVTNLAHDGRDRGYWRYRAVVSPWLWFLTKTADCRIFQQMTVPDILQEVFADSGFSDVDDRLTRTYREWEYCVQYRETDFNFVSRLMEQEGIYYYFSHADGAHTIVLCDDASAHEAAEGFGEIVFRPPSEDNTEGGDITAWNFWRSVQPATVVLTDYDFQQPTSDLEVRANVSRAHPRADAEIFDYPGEYVTAAEGDHYAQARIHELQTRFHQAAAATTARGLAVGGLFTLGDFPREDQNVEHLITRSTIRMANPERESETRDEGPSFDMTFRAIPSDQRFVSARTTPKPVVQGAQTAIVTGPSGEEIYTDEFGRVKVQFHWDRLGENDENTTCFIRVSQMWAGKEWGAMHLPRIGQEVIVSFLEGDPDRPIVTGRVYNGERPPPYGLADNKTQSGFLSRSSKEGGAANFNELRFEDKAGEEQVYLHAEKDFETVVENDETIHVMNDRTKTVDVDETNEIANNRTENVDNNEEITIGGNRTETVTANEDLTVSANRTEAITGNEDRTVGGSVTENVGAAVSQTVSGSYSQTVAGGITITTPAAVTINATGGVTIMGPAGIQKVDNFFGEFRAQNFTKFDIRLTVSGANFDEIGVQLGATQTKAEAVALKGEIVTQKIANKAAEMGSGAASVGHGAFHIIGAALLAIL